MDSDSLPRKAAAFTWADLPPKALEIISSRLRRHGEMVRLRSVCKSWRSSIPPKPHKLTPHFPFKSSLLGLGQPREPTFDVTINASGIYLILPRSNPTKLWLVCVREVAPGNLIFCHPLTYQEIKIPATDASDAYSFSLYTSKLVVRSYVHNEICIDCKGLVGISKVAFVGESSLTKLGLIGLSARKDITRKHLFAFTPDFRSRESTSNTTATTTAMPLLVGNCKCCCEFVSYVKFEGRLFVVDRQGHIFVLRAKKMQLVEISILRDAEHTKKDLVVSDGALYLISTLNGEYCRIYRLSVDENSLKKIIDDRNGHIVMEQVANVGEGRVVFIGTACSFSVPIRVLPRLWKRNCVVYLVVSSCVCGCNRCAAECSVEPEPEQIMVVHLPRAGADETSLKFNKISELQGYSDLFSPPSAPPS